MVVSLLRWFSWCTLSLLMASAVMVGCKSEAALSASGASVGIPSDFQLFITRTGCFGTCPVYELYVDPNGLVRYQGYQHVEHIGRFTKQLSEAQQSALVATIQKGDFFAMDSSYDDGTTDLATVITEVVMSGERHKVINRTGPKSVAKFQDELDAIIGTVGYVPAKKE